MPGITPIVTLRVVALALGFICLAPRGLAQMTTRNLMGTVSDGHHEPLKGAVIEVQNGVTTGIVSYITGTDGRYSFKRLDGQTDYRLWATFKGKRSKVRSLSQFDSDRPKTINFVIKWNR